MLKGYRRSEIRFTSKKTENFLPVTKGDVRAQILTPY